MEKVMSDTTSVEAAPALTDADLAPNPPPDAAGAAAPWLEVVGVERLDVRGTRVEHFIIDAPLDGQQVPGRVLEISGWALGTTDKVGEIWVLQSGVDIRRVPMNVDRPDVLEARHRPDMPVRCGFLFRLAVLAGARPVTYEIVGAIDDDTLVPLAKITVRSTPLPGGVGMLQPLMITTLGRSGSTLLMELLAHHPQIAAYSPRLYEARVSSYWVNVLKTLTQPASFLQAIAPTDLADPHWWLGTREPPPDLSLPDPRVWERMNSEGVDATVRFCLGRIESFYRHVAALSGRAEPRYFAEKLTPRAASAILWDLYPRTREVVLVRDFRDMVCSILAFNRKRGYNAFGYRDGQTPAEYVRSLRLSVVRLAEAMANRPEPPYVLRYEDLMRQPQETFAALMRYVGLASDPATVQGVFEGTAELMPGMQQYHATCGSPDGSIGRWRSELAGEARAAARETFDPFLTRFGYEPTD